MEAKSDNKYAQKYSTQERDLDNIRLNNCKKFYLKGVYSFMPLFPILRWNKVLLFVLKHSSVKNR